MTDKFPMHSDFPMDEAYKAKAAERGFSGDKALWLFEEWRQYWTGRPNEEKTSRGWIQCFDNNLKRKARNGAMNGISSRFERRDSNTMPTRPQIIWVGGRGFGPADMIAIRRKQALRQPLDHDELLALEKANG